MLVIYVKLIQLKYLYIRNKILQKCLKMWSYFSFKNMIVFFSMKTIVYKLIS